MLVSAPQTSSNKLTIVRRQSCLRGGIKTVVSICIRCPPIVISLFAVTTDTDFSGVFSVYMAQGYSSVNLRQVSFTSQGCDLGKDFSTRQLRGF